MISIGANGQRIAYGIKHYNLDTEADLELLKKRTEPMGSTCFVISTSKYYMLNSQKKWVEITPFGTAVTNNGGGSSGDNTPDDGDKDDIIYEGGVI